MRIIAGTARGTTLAVPKSVTRPTADRTREALFSILGDRIPGARVLDLFAGSGALGLEALSRGAASASFVEQNRAASEVIAKNADKAHLSDDAVVICSDVSKFLSRLPPPDQFDIIFADPPYKKGLADTDYGARLLRSDKLARLLKKEGIFVLEDWSGRVLDTGADPPDVWWELVDTRTYGAARLHLLRHRENA